MSEIGFSEQIEATASFQHSLDLSLRNHYPDVTLNTETCKNYLDGTIFHCSFEYSKPLTDVTKSVLETALIRAEDPNEFATYSAHGASGHTVFPEAIESLIKSVRENTINGSVNNVNVKTVIRGHKTLVPASRLVIETPRFHRETFEPTAFDEARSMKGNEVAGLRDIAVEKGMPYALLVGLFRHMDVDSLFSTIGNKEFVDKRMPKNQPWLSRNHRDDERIVTLLYNKLVLPRKDDGHRLPFSPSDYHEALDLMTQAGWLRAEDRLEGSKYGFKKVERTPYARAVFRGMTEFAQAKASENYMDPARTNYIDRRYGNKFSTKLITAFFVLD